MAGVYIHIPFCKTRCHYCDFYKTTDKTQEGEFMNALKREIDIKKDDFADEKVQTIYFGGGTPSYLGVDHLTAILDIFYRVFDVSRDAEVTLEANPDDIDDKWISTIMQDTPVNRISMGVQSFRDKDLSLMNRRHSASEAMKSMERLFEHGLSNVSIDLIYGLPGLSDEEWLYNLKSAFAFPIKHLSSYHLTFEPGTKFYQWQQQKRLLPVDEDQSLRQFRMLLDFIKERGFEQYEISNFSIPGYYSQHNLNYWRGVPYMGFGPSAHSFYKGQRHWNVMGLKKYIDAVTNGQSFYEAETIDRQTGYNEAVLTGLRTRWGIDMEGIQTDYQDYLFREAEKYILSGHLVRDGRHVKLTEKGLFISDRIMSDMMYVEEGNASLL